jgi:exodeoxyribonuclease VII small subunit
MSPSKTKTKTTLSPVEQMSYEQALAELETIVASLESNKLPLDETMSIFERGQALTKRCVDLLDKAELRLKQLSGDALIDLEMEE